MAPRSKHQKHRPADLSLSLRTSKGFLQLCNTATKSLVFKSRWVKDRHIGFREPKGIAAYSSRLTPEMTANFANDFLLNPICADRAWGELRAHALLIRAEVYHLKIMIEFLTLRT